MRVRSYFKKFGLVAATFPKTTALPTPKTHIPFQTAKRHTIRPGLSTSPSQQVAGAPNGSCKTLCGTGQNNAGRSYRENWPSASDIAYDAEYMQTVIESQKYIPRYPHYDFHHYPNVYSYDPSRRWVGM